MYTLKFSKQIAQLIWLHCIVRNRAIKRIECNFHLNIEKARRKLWCQHFCPLHSPKEAQFQDSGKDNIEEK